MHYWGDEGVDWVGIDSAACYIRDYCFKYARLGGSAKEKYGTVRFYCRFERLSLHALIYPAYCFNQFPNWLRKLDNKLISPILRFFFGKLFFKWQKVIYSRAYNNALKKWPHLRAEILDCADHIEFIKGVYRIEETETEIRTVILGWNNEEIGAWIRQK